jgi:hypothetical protein
MPTVAECKTMLIKAACRTGVPPNIISTKLLSPADKQDMLAGHLTQDELEAHVKVWKDMGMPRYRVFDKGV